MSKQADDHSHSDLPHDPKNADFSHWQLPDVTVVEESPTENLFGRTAAKREITEVEHQVLPPTLAEIEAIRAEAEAEGFEQGQQQGYQEGLEKGRLTGLEQGHEEGYNQGKEQGCQQGLLDAQQSVKQFESLMQQLVAPLALVDIEIEQSLLNLSMTLAKAVIGHELKTHPEHILAALRQGVDALPLKEQGIHIRLHPDDLQIVEQLYDAQQLQRNRWEMESDPSLNPGECIVNNTRSTVDMGLETRIKAVFENLVQSDTHLEQQKIQQQQEMAQQSSRAKVSEPPVNHADQTENQPPAGDKASEASPSDAEGPQDAEPTTPTAE